MTLNQVYEFATDETTITVFKTAASIVSGGMGLFIIQWVWSFFFGSGDEVRRILKALDGDEVLITQEVKVDTTSAGQKAKTLIVEPRNRVKIADSEIEIDPKAQLPRKPWWGKPEAASGVVFHGGVDKTHLYDRSELEAILSATTNRLAVLARADRAAGRRQVADSIPKPRKGNA